MKTKGAEEKININIVSFGYKHGIPEESDLVFDVRFLPNPYYIPEMKNHTGLDRDVSQYVMGFEEAKVFLQKLTDIAEYLIPLYEKSGKDFVRISIGCTGGHHRSVAVAETLLKVLQKDGYNVSVEHRDLEKEV